MHTPSGLQHSSRCLLAETFVLFLVLFSIAGNAHAQQVADTAFKPPVVNPAYEHGRGPVVLIDEAHDNFHTADGRYLPFAELLRRDGYVVLASRQPFDARSLRKGTVLVVANARSAFSDAEVQAVRAWVKEGGSLFLIVDHMPFPEAAEKLGAAFGARWSNGYAVDWKNNGEPLVFRRGDGSLREHAITKGRLPGEQVESVATFTGSAFQLEANREPLLVLGERIISFEPKIPGEFAADTKRVPVKGWYQGAVLASGKGRVALFGEAAMFSAQLGGPNREPMGMNAPVAARNPQFLLNILHWLSRRL